MKINKRRPIKSGEEIILADPGCCKTVNYDCCMEKIRDAIDCLCVFAEEDAVAQEAIANLSVVLFDLKTNSTPALTE